MTHRRLSSALQPRVPPPRPTAVLLLILAAGGLVAGEFPSAPPAAVSIPGLAEFGFALYAASARAPGNVAVSPLGAGMELSMLAAGASGNTLTQMCQVLRADLGDDAFHARYRDLRGSISRGLAGSGAELSIANGLWLQRGCPFRPAFTSLLSTAYAAQLKTADLAGPSALETINAWAAAATRNRIPRLLGDNPFAPGTRLALLNAIYFRGEWASRFPHEYTRDRPFFADGAQAVLAPTMFQEDRFLVYQGDGVTVVVLPYRQGAFSLSIVLPDARDGLSAVESHWNAEQADTWVLSATSRLADLYLPRFRIEHTLDLACALTAMGMPDAFSGRQAAFERLSSQPLHVSTALQRTVVETDERGTVATAVTYADMAVGETEPAPVEKPLVIRIDHPFLFMLSESSTGSILFLGRVTHP